MTRYATVPLPWASAKSLKSMSISARSSQDIPVEGPDSTKTTAIPRADALGMTAGPGEFDSPGPAA